MISPARRAGEAGYAMVAAVAAIAVFAALALGAATAARMSLLTGGAEIARAQATAAADAGIALALHELVTDDPRRAWPIDGRPRAATFGDARLVIRVRDERGKVPINRLDEASVTRLLGNAGLDGQALAIARDSLLDWLDEDDLVRADGAEAGFYATAGIQPRNGSLLSVDELGRVRGFSPGLVARLRPILTVEAGNASFDASHADPAAVAAMAEGGAASPQVIEQAREAAGQRTALALGASASLVGRPLTIAVDAAVADGRAHREAVVEITGSRLRPFVIRSYE